MNKPASRDRRHDPRPVRAPSASRGFQPMPYYRRMCGWCGRETQVVTDGRMLVCGACGR